MTGGANQEELSAMSREKIRGRNGEGEKPPTSGSLELVLGETPQNGLFCP